MTGLSRLLSSRVKAEVLRLLFGPRAPELHLREIARRADLNEATVRQEIKRLAGLGLLSRRRDGNRPYYRADGGHPLFADIGNLVLKTSGLADVLREALAQRGVRVAFVFGSIAAGAERSDSDIDLMVMGMPGTLAGARTRDGEGSHRRRKDTLCACRCTVPAERTGARAACSCCRTHHSTHAPVAR